MQGCVQQRRYVLGVTSLWLMVPVLSLPADGTVPIVLGIVATLVSTVTYALLHLPRIGRVVYFFDKVLAPVFFASLVVVHGGSIDEVGTACAVCTVLLFAVSRYLELTRRPGVLVAHLSFRFCGYWFVSSIAAVPTFTSVVVETLAYWTHAEFAFWQSRQRVKDAAWAAEYAVGCAQVAALVACVASATRLYCTC